MAFDNHNGVCFNQVEAGSHVYKKQSDLKPIMESQWIEKML